MLNPELARIDREIVGLKASLRAGERKEDGPMLGLADWQTERKIVMAEQQLPREAADWLRENYKPDDRIALVMIGPKCHTLQRIDTAENFARDHYQQYFRAQNAQGYNIHVSMAALRPEATTRTKADVAHVRHIYLDLDHGGRPALDRIRAELPPPSSVIQSSPGHYQVLWSAEKFQPAQAERLMKSMAKEYGADLAATDAARVMRLPGFINRKEVYRDNPPLVTLERGERGPAVEPKAFPERFYREIERPRQVREEERPRGDRQVNRTPVDHEHLIRQALERSQSQGRNAGGFWLACQMRDNGYAMRDAGVALERYQSRTGDVNTSGQREAYTIGEARASVRSAYTSPPREPWSARTQQEDRPR